jgi:DtxR family manganese transport transcriptional regulator
MVPKEAEEKRWKESAEAAHRPHQADVRILQHALGVPAEAAEADAEGIEHHVSETTLKAFARFLQSRQEP